jgi:hypothetical protein
MLQPTSVITIHITALADIHVEIHERTGTYSFYCTHVPLPAPAREVICIHPISSSACPAATISLGVLSDTFVSDTRLLSVQHCSSGGKSYQSACWAAVRLPIHVRDSPGSSPRARGTPASRAMLHVPRAKAVERRDLGPMCQTDMEASRASARECGIQRM